MKLHVKNWALSALAGLVIVSAFVLGWTWVIHSQRPVEFGALQTIVPPVARSGETVEICREITVRREATLEIQRAWSAPRSDGSVMTIDGGVAQIAAGTIVVTREPGYLVQCRPIALPTLTPGIWTLQNHITYRTWPFWVSTYPSPPVQVRVVR